jgi:hypothetical protein
MHLEVSDYHARTCDWIYALFERMELRADYGKALV